LKRYPSSAIRFNNSKEAKSTQPKVDFLKLADKDGQFRRQASKFRNFISSDPNSLFPAEKDRYVVYLNFGCPWAHRVNLLLHLKGLTSVIPIIVVDCELVPNGWSFTGRDGSATADPLYGFKHLREIYQKADPEYTGRYTVPCLWDKKKETVVNNESSEILRMLYSEFDAFVPEDRREDKRPLFPKHLQKDIEEMNEWVYDTVNNGVYKTGFATTQEAYEEHVHVLFASLDRLEKHLEQPGHSPFLFGEHITEADIRLFTTLIRFDAAYVTIFKCNLKMIRWEYPRLHDWLRKLYWDEGEESNGGAFKTTTRFDCVGFVSLEMLWLDLILTTCPDQERLCHGNEST
jgi:putative glutathione S-transferase